MKRSPDKSDFADAHLLADLCRVGYLPRVWLPPKVIRDLRRLTRFRQQLVDQRRDIKLRIRALLREERIDPRWMLETYGLSLGSNGCGKPNYCQNTVAG